MSSKSSKSSKNERVAERRALIEQQRKAQQAKERRRIIAGSGVVLLVVAGMVVALAFALKGNHTASGGAQVMPTAVTTADGQTTVEKPATKIPNTTGIEGVVAYDTAGYPGTVGSQADALPHDHVTGPVTYSVTPPVGGNHNGVWMNAGVYTEPLPTERAVHDLEHGAVWITYRPNLPASEVKALQDFVGKQSMIDESNNANRYMLLSPWASNTFPAPIVVSSWGYQLYLNSPMDPRLQEFVNTFRHNKTYTPEFGSPVDGVPINAGSQQGQLGGGNPAMYGSKYANQKNY